MLGIVIVFLLTAASLALLFWLAGVFLQGYLYTQPSDGLYWQAPAAAILLAGFITGWYALIFYSAEATTTRFPYDTIFRFNPEESMFPEPVRELKMVPKNGPTVVYKRYSKAISHFETRYVYLAGQAQKPWDHTAKEILLNYNDEELKFVGRNDGQGSYRVFVSDKGGWVLTEYDNGPSGNPSVFRFGRFLANLLLNFLHLALCVVIMWLVMRFLLSHALLMGVCLWVALTLVMLPMIFSYAGQAAQQRRAAAANTSSSPPLTPAPASK